MNAEEYLFMQVIFELLSQNEVTNYGFELQRHQVNCAGVILQYD